MTIGVGVLGTSKIGRADNLIPDTAILIADTMGSFGDIDSHGRLHKAMIYPEEGLYGVAADRIDRAAELLPIMRTFVGQIPKEKRSYGDLFRALSMACFMYKGDRFTATELPKLRLPPEIFDPRKAPADVNAKVDAAWNEYRIGCELIIAAFDGRGQAFLFEMSGEDETLELMAFPGFCAIGSGAGKALFWLSHREHTMGMLPERAAYHAYEAKLMAEASAHVNEHLDIIVATANEHWFTTSHPVFGQTNPPEHPTINLPTLKNWFKRCSARSTEGLGRGSKPKLLTARKAKQGQ
jgi:hypothetical protein